MKHLFARFFVGSGLVVMSLAVAYAANPAQIDLKAAFGVQGSKQAVIFNHAKHQASNACTDCHSGPAGGKGTLKVVIETKEGMANDFHKKLCWPCHEEKKVAQGKTCNTCHK